MSANMDNALEIQKMRTYIDELASENEKLKIERKRLEVEREKNIAELVDCKNQCAMLKKELDYIGGMDIRGENSRLKNCIIGLCLEIYGTERRL